MTQTPQATSLSYPVEVNTSSPYLSTRKLSLSYGRKFAFEDVSLDVKQGEISALIGPSGCGKTSFLSCLNRLTDLLSNCRVSGQIQIGNWDVMNPKIDAIALRRQVGMIFQKPNPFPFSIWKNIAFPLKEHGVKERDRLDRIIEQVLRDVGLWDEVKDRLKSSALSLSGGQQQRLCIARSLALEPEVLLMDEPCSALDPISSGIVEDLIASLRDKYTVLIVTHNLAQAKRIADSASFFWVQNDSGYLIETGSVEQIFQAPKDPITAAYVSGTKG